MILNNLKTYLKYYNLCNGCFDDYYSSTTVVVTFADGEEIRDMTGNSCNTLMMSHKSYHNKMPFQSFSTSYVPFLSNVVGNGQTGIAFGRGTKDVAESDYCLDIMITTGLSGSGLRTVHTFTNSSDGKSVVRKTTITVNIKNTATEDVTITEVGFFAPIYCKSNGTVSQVMIHRILLDEAVTIQSGANATFTFEIILTNSIA